MSSRISDAFRSTYLEFIRRGLSEVGWRLILNGVMSSMDVSWDSGLSFEDVGSLVEIESMFDVLKVEILEISFLDFCVV